MPGRCARVVSGSSVAVLRVNSPISLGAIGIDGLPDCTQAIIEVLNPSANTGHTITAGVLQFTDTVGGVTSTITYPSQALSIAPGAVGTFVVPLTQGYLAIGWVLVTFDTNPLAVTLQAKVSFT